MARGATWRRRNNVGGSSLGGTTLGGWSLARQLSVEGLEERTLLAVTVTNKEIEVDEGLYVGPTADRHSDKIPRLSAWNTRAPNYTSGNNTFTVDYFVADTSGDWYTSETSSIWKKNDQATTEIPSNGSFVLIPEGITVKFNYEMTTTSLVNLEVAGTLTFDDNGGSGITRTLRAGTIYVLPTGSLNINFTDHADKANIVFTDFGWGDSSTTNGGKYAAIDSGHFTGGLIAYGTVNINGASNFEWTSSAKTAYASDTDRGVGEQQKIGTWSSIYSGADATSTSIVLDKWVDWKANDLVVIPDTRRTEILGDESGNQTEIKMISTVDSVTGQDSVTRMRVNFKTQDGYTNTLANTHAGYTSSLSAGIGFKPIAGLLTHNVKLYSAVTVDPNPSAPDPNRPRAHTMFGGNAQVHITFAELRNLGRTDATQSVFVDPDFINPADANQNNRAGRYALHLHHLYGPLGTTAQIAAMEPQWLRKYAFVIAGNSIVGSKKWAMALHDSSFGDIRGNVIHDAQGAGIVTEDGSEIGNQISYNLVTNITGNGDSSYDDGQGGAYANPAVNWVERQENSDIARGGSAFWFRRSGNDVKGNVAMDSLHAGYVYSSYNLETVVHLAIRGLDKSASTSNYTVALANPAGTFIDNTAIGKSRNGAWFAYVSGRNLAVADADPTIGAYGYETPVFDAVNFRAFNMTTNGVIAYHVTNLKFTDLAVVNDHLQWTSYFGHSAGGFNTVASYENINVLFVGGIIENMGTGMISALGDASEPHVYNENGQWRYATRYFDAGPMNGALAGGTTVRGMKFKNWINFVMTTAAPRGFDHNTVLLDNVEFHPGLFGRAFWTTDKLDNPYRPVQSLDDPNVTNFESIPRQNIWMDFDRGHDTQLLSTTSLLVHNGLKIYKFDANGQEVRIDDSGLADSRQIYFGEQQKDYVIPQGDALSLTAITPHVVGQPGYRTSGSSTALDNEALWADYGLSAAGEVLPGSAVLAELDYGFVSDDTGTGSIRPYVGALPTYRVLPGEGTLPGENPRLSLVTPWDGGQLVVPLGQASTSLWVRAQVNGGLKQSGGAPIETVKITYRDVTPGSTDTDHTESDLQTYFTVYPWHTYEVIVKISDLETPFTVRAARSATVTVVQPHITAVKFSSVSNDVETSVNSIAMGTTPSGASLQMRSISDAVNTVSITFNTLMSSENMSTALKLIPVNQGMSTINATYVGWNAATKTASWTVAGAGGLAAGQYFVHLAGNLEDEDDNALSNGWINPRSLTDIHPRISAVALDGSINDDFRFAVTILPGDTQHDNDHNGHDFTSWPPVFIKSIHVSDHRDSDFSHARLQSVGSKEQLTRVATAGADIISVTFSQPLPMRGINGLLNNGLRIERTDTNDGDTAYVVAGLYYWDQATLTASWRLDTDTSTSTTPIIFGIYHLLLPETLLDSLGRAIDGEWINPTSPDDETTSVSSYSGEGHVGGQFDFVMVFFPVDVNGDFTADFTDLGIILNNYGLPGDLEHGDVNGDGQVNFTDLGLLFNWFNVSIWS